MGGKALKNTFTRRYEKEEYHELVKEVTTMLSSLFPITRIEVIKAYEDKDSFGDMDILIETDNLPSNWTDTIVKYLLPKEFVSNGDVFSFEYKEFQIDLIKSKSELFDFSLVYFSYNDLGNLMGRIAHKIGLKFGHRGLIYVLRDKDKVIKEITLSNSAEEVLTFLGYDFKRYQSGFRTLEDIFNFVVSTQYFNLEIYLFDNMNNKSRTRDAKRKTYNEFLSWLSLEYYNRKIPAYQFNKDKSYYESGIFEYFPESKLLVKQAVEEDHTNSLFSDKFNGNLIMTLTGLSGKDLGIFIKLVINNNGGEEEFKNKVLRLSSFGVVDLIMTEYKNSYSVTGDNKMNNPIENLRNMSIESHVEVSADINDHVLFVLERLEQCIFDKDAGHVRSQVKKFLDDNQYSPLKNLNEVLDHDLRLSFLMFERDLLNMGNSNIDDVGSLQDISTSVHAVLIDVVSTIVKSDNKVFSVESLTIARDNIKGTKYEVLLG